MKALKITGCSDSLLWYSKKIGQYVDYLGEDIDRKGPIFWSRDNGGYKNIVFKKDAELVEIEVKDGKWLV
jgi:hypothetical protein